MPTRTRNAKKKDP